MLKQQPAFYILKHIPSGKFYGGSSATVRNRISDHRNRLRDGIHPNKLFQEVYTNWNDVEIRVHYTSSIEVARDLESEFLTRFHGSNNCCNTYSTNLDPKLPRLDSLGDPVILTRMDVHHGRRKGVRPSEDTGRKISLANTGRKNTDETKTRMSHSATTSLKVKAAHKARESKDFVVIEINGVRYNSIAAASRALGIGHSTITQRLNLESFTEWNRITVTEY